MKNVKRLAIIESLVNVGSGLLISVFVAQPIIFYIYDISLGISTNVVIATYFTLISILRGYVWRLFFHRWFYVKDKGGVK